MPVMPVQLGDSAFVPAGAVGLIPETADRVLTPMCCISKSGSLFALTPEL